MSLTEIETIGGVVGKRMKEIIKRFFKEEHDSIKSSVYTESEGLKSVSNVKDRIKKYLEGKLRKNNDISLKNITRETENELKLIFGTEQFERLLEEFERKLTKNKLIKKIKAKSYDKSGLQNWKEAENYVKEIGSSIRNHEIGIDPYVENKVLEGIKEGVNEKPKKDPSRTKPDTQKPDTQKKVLESVGLSDDEIESTQAQQKKHGRKSILDYIDKNNLKKVSMLSGLALGLPIGLFTTERIYDRLFNKDMTNKQLLSKIIQSDKKQDVKKDDNNQKPQIIQTTIVDVSKGKKGYF